jgi:hypothetical protein
MRVWVSASLALLLGAVTAAQHTPAAKFDLGKPLTLTGTVTQIDWANPYAHVLMKVAGPSPASTAIDFSSGQGSECLAFPGASSPTKRSVWVHRENRRNIA